MVIDVIKSVLKKGFVRISQDESLVTYDFLITSPQKALMQFCFSTLNRWWIFLVIGLIAISPLRHQFSIHQLWGPDHWMVGVMYSGKLLIPFVVFLFLSVIFGSHTVWVLVLFYLMAQGDVHVLFGLAGLSGIFLADARRFLKKSTQIRGLVRNVVLWIAGVHVLSLVISSFLNFYLYQSFYNLGYFAGSIYENRFEFLVLALFVHYVVQFVGLSIWGHFYSRQKQDPSMWNLKYSTGSVLNLFWFSRSFKHDLHRVIDEKLKTTYHQEPQDQKGLPQKLIELYLEEKSFLQDAQTHLN